MSVLETHPAESDLRDFKPLFNESEDDLKVVDLTSSPANTTYGQANSPVDSPVNGLATSPIESQVSSSSDYL